MLSSWLTFTATSVYFCSWLIFEIQVILISQLPNISKAQIAACGIWVQLEGLVGATQSGFILTTSMRVIYLLGKF